MDAEKIRNEIDRLFIVRAKIINSMKSGYLQAYTLGCFEGFVLCALKAGAITEDEKQFLMRASVIFNIRCYLDEDFL